MNVKGIHILASDHLLDVGSPVLGGGTDIAPQRTQELVPDPDLDRKSVV